MGENVKSIPIDPTLYRSNLGSVVGGVVAGLTTLAFSAFSGAVVLVGIAAGAFYGAVSGGILYSLQKAPNLLIANRGRIIRVHLPLLYPRPWRSNRDKIE